MFINITVGFVIPWVLGSILYLKNKYIVLTIAPLAAAISFCVNCIGFFLKFWALVPFHFKNMAALPINLGLYPFLASCAAYYLNKYNPNIILFTLFITLFTTILEYLAYLLGRVVYMHNWNIGFTFLSYLIPYTLLFNYFLLLKKTGIYDKNYK